MATANPAKSAAAQATAVDNGAAMPARGKKKLLLIVAVVLVLALLAAGAAAYFVVAQNRAAAQAAGLDLYGDGAQAEEKKKPANTTPPSFLPLDPFVVNLADKDSDRFAQVGITLEVHDSASADTLRAYMPAIRNGILLVLAQKTSAELLSAEGKRALATEVMREAMRPLADNGIASTGDGHPLVRAVHFSSFIIQ